MSDIFTNMYNLKELCCKNITSIVYLRMLFIRSSKKNINN